MSNRDAAILGLALLTTVLAGCGTSPREYFYTLSSTMTSGSGSAAGTMTVPSIVVGPVTLPEIADRPQIVTRVGANRVAIAEQHRWAASLKNEIPRVVAENLSELLGSKSISSYEESSSTRADIQILMDVQRFDATLGKTATIESLWTVRRAVGKPTTGRSAVQEPIGDDGYEGLIAAYSRALANVSRDIGEAIGSTEAMRR
jgi:uncharacterized lipoprotein YmbA